MHSKISHNIVQYLLGMMVAAFALSSCTSKPGSAPVKYTGNYYDVTGKKIWVVGIEKHFILYESRLWNLEKCKVRQHKAIFNLEHDGEKRRITLAETDSGFCELADGNVRYTLQRKPAAGFPLPENKPFSMQPGTAVIAGCIKNAKKYTAEHPRIEFFFNNYITLSTTSQYADIDSIGRFSLSFDLFCAQNIMFKYNSDNENIFVSPGDTLLLYYDPENPDKSDFQGTHADACYTMQATDSIRALLLSYQDEMKFLSHPFEEYRAFQDSMLQKKKEWLNQLEKITSISAAFKSWYLATAYLDHEVNLLNYGWKNYYPKFKGKYRELYRSIHTSILLSGNYADTTLLISSMFFFYTTPFCNYIFKPDETWEEEQKALIHRQHPGFSDYEADTAYQKRAIRMEVQKALQMKPSPMRDICLCRIVVRMIEFRQPYLPDETLTLIKPLISNSYYKNQLIAFVDEFHRREQSFKELPVTLMKTQNSGDALLKEIVAKNKDKSLILDFWFTGCSACRRDFAGFAPFKEELHQRDIEFVYLCYDSNEKSWKQVINEFQLKGQHYMLNDEQLMYLRKKFAISGAPHYVFINKAGVVVNSHLHLPLDKNSFFQEVSRQH